MWIVDKCPMCESSIRVFQLGEGEYNIVNYGKISLLLIGPATGPQQAALHTCASSEPDLLTSQNKDCWW